MESILQHWEMGLLLPLIIGLTGVQAVACGAWAQILARARGYSGIKWFWVGFFLSAAGVIWADKLPALVAYERRCGRGFICSRLCAFVNGCHDNEPTREIT